jgi:hypothetical protein
MEIFVISSQNPLKSALQLGLPLANHKLLIIGNFFISEGGILRMMN